MFALFSFFLLLISFLFRRFVFDTVRVVFAQDKWLFCQIIMKKIDYV